MVRVSAARKKETGVDWQLMSSTSHYQTAVAVANELRNGNVEEAETGLQELIDAVARSERRAVRSQLIRAMAHVLKWKSQPSRRSGSWASSIYQAREEIAASQEDVPSITRQTVERIWDRAFAAAKVQAETETQEAVLIDTLTWEEVFEDDFGIPNGGTVRKKRGRKGGKR